MVSERVVSSGLLRTTAPWPTTQSRWKSTRSPSKVPELRRTLPAIGSAELRQPALPWSAVPPIGASVATLLTPLPCPPRRSVLKLVSCVQQERGITCGWVAGCGSLDYFGARLDERRAATDAAITKEVALIFPWVSPELVQLRGEVDRAAVHHRHLADGSLATDAAAADADAAADASRRRLCAFVPFVDMANHADDLTLTLTLNLTLTL